MRIGFPVVGDAHMDAAWVSTELTSSRRPQAQCGLCILDPDTPSRDPAFNKAIQAVLRNQDIRFDFDSCATPGLTLSQCEEGDMFQINVTGGSFGLVLEIASRFRMDSRRGGSDVLISASVDYINNAPAPLTSYRSGIKYLYKKWKFAKENGLILFVMNHDFELLKYEAQKLVNGASDFMLSSDSYETFEDLQASFTEWQAGHPSQGRVYSLAQIVHWTNDSHAFDTLGRFLGLERIRGRSAATPLVRHNLPREHFAFIGREEEIRKIWKLLEGRPFLISITGVGGVGKTALATEIGRQALLERDGTPPLFEYCVFASAKVEYFRDGKSFPKEKAISSTEDIIFEILNTLKGAKVAGVDKVLGSSLEKQDERVKELLRENRVLLIVDNMESLDDPRVNEFLADIPSPSKVLMTDRRAFKSSSAVELTKMATQDSLDFIGSILQSRGLSLDEGDKQMILENTGSIPLAMEWALGQIASGIDVETVCMNVGSSQKSSALTEYMFKNVFGSLDPNARTALVHAALPGTKVQGKMITSWTGLDEEHTRGALVDLMDYAILQCHDEVDTKIKTLERTYQVPTLTRNYLMATARDELQQAAQNIPIQLLRKLQEAETIIDWPSPKTIDHIDTYHKLYIWAIESAIETNAIATGLELVRPVAYVLGIRGRNQLRLSLAQLCFAAAETTDNTFEMARNLIFNIGWVYFIWYQFDECREAMNHGLKLAEKCESDLLYGGALRMLGLIEKEEKNYQEAEKLLQSALKRIKSADNKYHISITLGSIASLKRDMGNFEEFERFLLDELEIINSIPNTEELKGITFRRLSEYYLEYGNLENANEYNELSREIDEKLKRPAGKAQYLKKKARIFEKRGDLHTALQLAEQAKDLFIIYGREADIAKDIARISRQISPPVN